MSDLRSLSRRWRIALLLSALQVALCGGAAFAEQVRIPLTKDGSATEVPATVDVRLVDADGEAVIGFHGGWQITEYIRRELTGADWIADLAPQSEIATEDGSPTWYKIVVEAGRATADWRIQVPVSAVVLELEDLVGAAAIPPADINAGRLIPEGGATGQVLGKLSATDFDVDWLTPAGGGDMLAAVYDPQAIAGDAFARASHTGTQAGTSVTISGPWSGNLVVPDPGDVQALAEAVDGLSGGGGASQLSDLSDVNTSTPTNRNLLVADGVDWESRALVEADVSDLGSYLAGTGVFADNCILRADGAGGDSLQCSGVTLSDEAANVFTLSLPAADDTLAFNSLLSANNKITVDYDRPAVEQVGFAQEFEVSINVDVTGTITQDDTSRTPLNIELYYPLGTSGQHQGGYAAQFGAWVSGSGDYGWIIGNNNWASFDPSDPAATVGQLIGQQTAAYPGDGEASEVIGTYAYAYSLGGTHGTLTGVKADADIYGGSTANRFGVHIPAFTGSATTLDYALYSQATQDSFFAGQLIIPDATSATHALNRQTGDARYLQSVPADSVGTAELDDGADTPAARDVVHVDPADTTQIIYYAAPSGGTDGCAGTADKVTFNSTTGTWSCGTDAGAGGGMTSWVLAADTGATETVLDGETVTFLGGNGGVDTQVGPTDTVTVSYDASEAQAANEAFIQLPNLQGVLTAAKGGTGQTSLGAVDAADLGSGVATNAYVLTADGAGNAAWAAQTGGSGLHADLTDLSTSGHPDTVVSHAVIGTPTYDTVADLFALTESSGVADGAAITDNGDGTVDVALGYGLVRATDSPIAAPVLFDIPATASLAMTNGSANYVYVDYNAGAPVVGVETSQTANGRTKFYIGQVFREGTQLDIVTAGQRISEPLRRIQAREVGVNGKAIRATGGAIAEISTRYIISTELKGFAGFSPITLRAIDTSGVDTMEQYYQDGVGGWTENDVSQINNLNYDDGSGTLATLTDGDYGVWFLFLGTAGDGTAMLVAGRDSYSLREAEAAQVPTNLPPHVSGGFSIFAAKLIVQKSATNLTEVQGAFDQGFTSTVVEVLSTDITDSTAAGRSMLTAADAAAQRALLTVPDVSGTPVDGQLGVWTGAAQLEGDAALTFDTVTDRLAIAASGKLSFGAVDVLSDAAGTATLGNIDALDATTESTIETAIDTAPNLSITESQISDLAHTTFTSLDTDYGDETITSKYDVSGGKLEIPNSATPPTPCNDGQIYYDTDARKGERLRACESNAWIRQGSNTTIWRASDNSTALTAGAVDVDCFYTRHDITLTDIYASVTTQGGTSGTLTVDVNDDGTTIMATNKLDIQYSAVLDDGTATLSGTPPLIAAGSKICAQVDAVSAAGTEAGLVIQFDWY